MGLDCDLSTKAKRRLLFAIGVVVVVSIAVAVPLALRSGEEEGGSGSTGEKGIGTVNEQQCIFTELEKLPLPSAMRGQYPLKSEGLPAISRMQVAPTLDAFVVKLNLSGNQDLILMIQNLAGQWDEVVLDDALPDAVNGWDLSSDGNRLAYRHIPASCPNSETFCNGYKLVQINKGASDGGVVTTLSEVLSVEEEVMSDKVVLNHDGTIAASLWQGGFSSATGFSQGAVMMHDDTGMKMGGTRLVEEFVLDLLIEEGQRVSYYAHNPFTNVNRLDVIELDDDGNWLDVVNPHPTFVSIRFTQPALLNNGETVAYCMIDNDFNGELEFQELKDGAWIILPDQAHGDLQDHACRDIKFSQDHTKILLQFKDGSNGDGHDNIGMFWLVNGVWTKKGVFKMPDEALVSPFERGVALDNELLAMDSSASRMMMLVNGPHPDHANSEQHLVHYGFGCNASS